MLNVLPPIYPLSEDLLLLGIIPLASFHKKVDFFKENAYEVDDEHTFEARKQVRWGRIRDMIKSIADSNSFDFIQYNQTEQKYIVIDENAKRQQQGRFMKALATQRLMEQVSSLEKNVNRMTLGKKQEVTPTTKREVYTCVVDVTAFLDGLNKVKRWATQTLNVDRRSQGSILEVVVPLEVIDSLDDHKKGTSHMNMQARESIRFLDQKLLENGNRTDMPTSSFLRTQKVSEKLSDWNEAKSFWIGEESRSNVVDNLLSEEEEAKEEDEEEEEEEEDEEEEIVSDAESDDSSDGDLFQSRRRGGGSDSEESDLESASSDEEESEEENEAGEEYDYTESFEEEDQEDEAPYTFNDVPKGYRPVLSCLLYYHSKQQAREDNQPERLVLVTNDEDLAWWAELFGDPKTGKRLLIKTVNEWDQMVGKLDFEKVYDYSWKKR